MTKPKKRGRAQCTVWQNSNRVELSVLLRSASLGDGVTMRKLAEGVRHHRIRATSCIEFLKPVVLGLGLQLESFKTQTPEISSWGYGHTLTCEIRTTMRFTAPELRDYAEAIRHLCWDAFEKEWYL